MEIDRSTLPRFLVFSLIIVLVSYLTSLFQIANEGALLTLCIAIFLAISFFLFINYFRIRLARILLVVLLILQLLIKCLYDVQSLSLGITAKYVETVSVSLSILLMALVVIKEKNVDYVLRLKTVLKSLVMGPIAYILLSEIGLMMWSIFKASCTAEVCLSGALSSYLILAMAFEIAGELRKWTRIVSLGVFICEALLLFNRPVELSNLLLTICSLTFMIVYLVSVVKERYK